MDRHHVSNIFNEIPFVLVPEFPEEYLDQNPIAGIDLFEYLQECGVIRMDFMREIAVLTNLMFRLANLLVVSLHFEHTMRYGANVP